MNVITGFKPVLGSNPRVLILGSMPSVASLKQQQYYGKPQNAFWRIMGALFGAGADLPYEQRTAVLAAAGVAVWDVLASCVRPGSLDSAIEMDTAVPNPIVDLLAEHPGIGHIFFNGRKAEQIFRKHLHTDINKRWPTIEFTVLPSTSPAMASLGFAEKLLQWEVVRRAVNNSTA